MPQSVAVYSIEICNSPANGSKVAFKTPPEAFRVTK